MKIKVIIPFRLREGADPRRQANLDYVQAWWYAHGFDPQIVSDGLVGDAQFNRHRAYNRGAALFPETDVFVFAEADMLVHPDQIKEAVALANRRLSGLVVPFTQYRYFSDANTEALREFFFDLPADATAEMWSQPVDSPSSIFSWEPESTMDNGTSIGAINVVSADTLEKTGGFTEATSGNWYDDNIIEEGFAFLTGSHTRYVEGPAVHMYHLPGHAGAHVTEAERLATEHNFALLKQMRRDVNMGRREPVRKLMEVRS